MSDGQDSPGPEPSRLKIAMDDWREALGRALSREASDEKKEGESSEDTEEEADDDDRNANITNEYEDEPVSPRADWLGYERSELMPRVLAAMSGLFLVGGVLGIASLIAWWGAEVHRASEAISVPQILLTAASLFILIFSVFVGVTAFFGWREIENVIERKVLSVQDDAESKFRGGIKLATGVMYGRLARIDSSIDHEGPPPLDAAIAVTHDAHKLLEEVGTDADRIKAANNLAFFYALKGDPEFAPKAISLARRIKDHPDFGHDPEYIDTYCHVLCTYWEFIDDPEKWFVVAIKKARSLRSRGDLDARQRKNAHRTLLRVQWARQEMNRRSGA